MDNPNKLEGEPEFVLDFWQRAQDGQADEVDGPVFKFRITREDAEKYPELKPGMLLMLAESAQGEVLHQLLGPRVTN